MATPQHPCFTVTPAPGNTLHRTMAIPHSFMDGHGGGLVGKTVDLQGANGRTWLAMVDHRGFANNWPAFARDNNFQPSDSLLFTMVALNCKFTVRVVSTNNNLPTNASAPGLVAPEYPQSKGDERNHDDDRFMGTESNGRGGFGNGGHGVPAPADEAGPSKKRRGRPPKQAVAGMTSPANGSRPRFVTTAIAARQMETKRPSISVTLKPSAVMDGFFVTIPLKYARLHLPGGSGPITLQDTLGSKYCATWAITRHHGEITGDGWRAFSIHHRLQEGDACVFEVLHCKDRACVIRVHIYRVVQVPDFVPRDRPAGGCDVGNRRPPVARREGHSSDHELPMDDHALETSAPTTDGRRQGEDVNRKGKMKMRDEDL